MKNWNISRIIRLIAAIGIAIYALIAKDYIFLSLAALLLVLAILNLPRCGCSSGCSDDNSVKQKQVYKDQIKEYKR